MASNARRKTTPAKLPEYTVTIWRQFTVSVNADGLMGAEEAAHRMLAVFPAGTVMLSSIARVESGAVSP